MEQDRTGYNIASRLGGGIDGYDDGEQPLQFHHKNGEFRKYYEGDHLKDIATGKENPRKGFFKCLVATKPNRMIFTGMILCFCLVFVINLLGSKGNEGIVDGMFCDLSSFSFQESLYVTLDVYPSFKTRRMHIGDFEKKDLEISIYVENNDGAVSERFETIYLYDSPSGEKKSIYATFPDYDSNRVVATVSSSGKSVNISSKIISK